MHNIEKSAFRKGQYVGYSGCNTWRINKTNSSFGNWCATTENSRMPHMFSFTLREMSSKLETVEAWATKYEGASIRY